MPRLFRPCADNPARWVRFYYPVGSDIPAVCAANGWAMKIPEGVEVLAEDGSVIQGATLAPDPEPDPEPVKGQSK